MNWSGYWKSFLATLVAVLLFLIVVLWVVDPYGNLPGSPPFDRTAMASNQRFSYPAVARSQKFDSAVIGTSTVRMLEPGVLNAAFGGRFANLAMNSATAYEQTRLFGVFRQNHSAPKTVLIGVDKVWCTFAAATEKYTFRRFPEWMYDENPWNDLPHMLELKSFENLGRQAAYLLGLKAAKYRPDGYANFLPPDNQYDLRKARQAIYGAPEPKHKTAAESPLTIAAATRAQWLFPTHADLRDMLSGLPDATRKILFFVPYHAYLQSAPGTQTFIETQECKARIKQIVAPLENAVLLDFMIVSPLTVRDENYWDPLHYSAKVADRLVQLIARGADKLPAADGEYRILH